MPASSVTVSGQRVVIPGAYSELDVSRAASPGVLAAGIPCLVGEGQGPEPQKVQSFNSLDELRLAYRSGDILEAAEIIYDAVRDTRVAGRPTKCFVVQTNQNTQSTATFNSASGAAMTVTSEGYGAFTERISINIVSGTLKGISVTVQLDDVTESVDDLGGDNIFSLAYTGSATAMAATTSATGLAVAQTFSQVGLEGTEITAGWGVGDVASVVSAAAYDDFQTVTVYGHNATNQPISESVTLNGTTAVTTTAVFQAVTGVAMSAMSAGAVTVDDEIPLTIATFSADLDAVPLTPADVLDVQSANAADVGQLVRIEGRRADGTPVIETVTLNGLTAATTTEKFEKITAVQITGTTVGSVTVDDQTPQTVVTLGAGTDVQKGFFIERGLRYPTDLSFDGTISMSSSGASTDFVIFRGTDSTGATASEALALNGATVVTTTTSWKTISQIEMGVVPNATDTVTFTNTAFNATVPDFDVFDTLEAFVNAKPGFTLTQLATAGLTLSDMDYLASININEVTANFTADLVTAINWLNDNSAIVTATRASGGTGQLLVLASPKYLSGGADVAATNNDFRDALALLEDQELDYITLLSDSAVVHAFGDAHAVKMATASGRSERMIYSGVAVNATKTSVKQAAAALNSRHFNLLYQEHRGIDVDGELKWFKPYFTAAMQMGAQASARRGVPLTLKRPNLIDVRQHSTFNPKRDAAELIDAGVSNIVPHPTAGFVWQRTMTTYLKKTINAFQESSANDSLNASVKDLRGFLEVEIVGEPDVDISPAAIKRFAEAQLERQLAAKLIAAYRAVTVNTLGTQVEVSYEVAPVVPRNFVVLTTHVFEVADAA